MISLSEIDTTSKRATKAAGFSWGIAEEVGKNIRLLELYGLPGIKNLNEYFKNYKNKHYQKASLISEINDSQKIASMEENSKKNGTPDATEKITNIIMKIAES